MHLSYLLATDMTDLEKTPQVIGFVNASAIAILPTNQSVSSHDKQLLQTAELPERAYLGECYLLCACAFLHSVRITTSQMISDQLVDGFKLFLQQNKESPHLAYALEHLDAALADYAVAANADHSKGPPPPGEMAEIDIAFGDRLFNLAKDDNETCAQACMQLSAATPHVFWNVYAKAALTELRDAKIILQ